VDNKRLAGGHNSRRGRAPDPDPATVGNFVFVPTR